jgi:hypothetical protein
MTAARNLPRTPAVGAGAALLSLLASCSSTQNLLPVNDFNRPTDVAFMCFGAFPDGTVNGSVKENVVSGRPMRECHPPNAYDPTPSLTSRTFAFIADSASGGLTALDADNWKLVDLDPATEGYGQLPLGSNPAQISVSDDGCRLLSANRDSCDLSLVDPSVLVASVISTENSNSTNTVKVPEPQQAAITFRPKRADGSPLVAAPFEAVFLPQDTALAGYDTQGNLCQTGADAVAQSGPPGWAPAGPSPWHALVTYPSCNLIVLLELPSGNIEDSVRVQVDKTGNTVELVSAGKSPTCAATACGGQALPPDAGAATGSDANARADAASDSLGSDAATTSADAARSDAGADARAPAVGDAASDRGADAAASDASAADAASPVPGLQRADKPYVDPAGELSPGPIAIKPTSSGNLRAYVGLENASFVVALDLLSPGTLDAATSTSIYLHEGAKGVSRVRLSIDPYKYPGDRGLASTGRWDGTAAPLVSGAFVGSADDSRASADEGAKVSLADRQYLYAIARDGTLRVVNVSTAPETECETNIDPLNLPKTAAGALAADPTNPCIPVDPAHRRPFSVGPGIHFPTLPIDIAAANIVAPPSSSTANGVDEDHSEQSVQGAYAWVITASGVVYLVNIDPVLRQFSAVVRDSSTNQYGYSTSVQEQWPFINTIRDRNEISYYSGLDPSSGPPRIDVLTTLPVTGPYVEQFWTQGSDHNATALTSDFVETAVFFPHQPPLPASMPANLQDPIDRRSVTPQTWSVTWQGVLTGTESGGQVLGESSTGPKGQTTTVRDAAFQDRGASFCTAGVVPGDVVTLTGCTTNSQCGVGETCLLNAGLTTGANGLPITGLCVDPNIADATNGPGTTCLGFLSSLRRYEIVAATPTALTVRPHLDEVVLPSLAPCVAKTATTADSCPDTLNDPTTAKFTCQVGPIGSGGSRCLMSCAKDTDCRVGMTCVDFANPSSACDDGHCFCAEAPPLDATAIKCVDQLTNYQLSVGGGFLVEGTSTGIVTTAAVQADGTCAPNPTPDPRFSFRIPMNAPHCGPVAGTAIDNPYDSRVDPELVPASSPSPTPNENQQQAWTDFATRLTTIVESTPSPDPCLYFGGPVASDAATVDYSTLPALPSDTSSTPGGPPKLIHVRALFRNAQLGFVLANLDRPPVGQFQGTFDVHGGFNPQVVQDPSTVEVSMPARIVVGPVDSQSQTLGMPFTTVHAPEVPYLFVVDQRRLGREQGGGPTRGQLLRIHPLDYTVTVGSATGTGPIFQDYTVSGGVFPIQ